MKTELHLDYQTVLANQAQPVHFAVKFHADEVPVARLQPAAFCVVLDRSGLMQRAKLDYRYRSSRIAFRITIRLLNWWAIAPPIMCR